MSSTIPASTAEYSTLSAMLYHYPAANYAVRTATGWLPAHNLETARMIRPSKEDSIFAPWVGATWVPITQFD